MPGKFGRQTLSNKAGASPGEKMWGGHTWRVRGARTYNGVWDEPPAGSRAEPLHGQGVRGQSPPEAENLLAFAAQRKQQIFFILQASNRDRPNSLLRSKNSPDLHQSQERPMAKVGWTCPPQSTLWRRP